MQLTPMYRSTRTAATLMALASTLPAVITSANAGEGSGGYGHSSLAQREIIRRQNDVAEADRLLLEGREAYARGDFQQAVDKYSQALDRLPNSPTFDDRRASFTGHLADASVALSMQHRKVGKYAEARTLLDRVLVVDPGNALATQELAFLDDPIRTNPALTYEHTQNVDAVRRKLYTAQGNFDLGKFDAAKTSYEEVLRIDPYNTAARRGMERLSAAKSDYYRAAYDQTRAELLSQVDAAWELTVPAEMPNLPLDRVGTDSTGTGGVAVITEKLRRIIIPRIDFEDTTVEEAVDFLRLRSAELDTLELDPARKGVNFVVRRPRTPAGGAAPDAGLDAGTGLEALPAGGGTDPNTLRIRELRLRNVPLGVALKYIGEQTKLRYKVDDFAVTLVPQTETDEEIFSRSFTVPPDFAASLDTGAGGGGDAAEADPFGDAGGGAGASAIQARKPIQELLKNSGINFPEGASASLSANGVLIVQNTPTELDKIEQLVQMMANRQPKQVKITTKFVEISQENSDELGFDWVIGPFDINSSGSVVGSGGTIGNGTTRTGLDFTAPLVPGIPTSDDAVSNIVTAGNRSGDAAVSRNSIDAILNNPNRTAQTANVAPGIMQLTGLFSDGEVKMIMRGLSQKKGADLMTAPSVTARSGQSAKIEIIREFIYPTEYEPPELPNSVGTTSGTFIPGIGGGIGGTSGGSFPVTPATPTAFETRPTGVTLEVEPTIGENDFLINLKFVPEITEFEGFINYGSPIQAPGTDSLGNPVVSIITENRIEMPVFSIRRVTSELSIYDGYTVAIGGLIREDVQNVEDKVPILGDIPFIGRLFQTKAENRIKSNLIVFVTAQIIDATGRPLRGADTGSTIPAPGTDAGLGDLDTVLPPL